MAVIAPSDLTEQLAWRYAVKRFDPSRPIAAEAWQSLLQALRLAPSSFGLQPWRFLIVDDPALRQRLRALARDQAQITDADRLVVFQAHTEVDAAHVGRHAATIAAIRSDTAAADTYRARVTKVITESHTAESRREWAIRQTYIALGQYLAAAAVLGVDACPMEGFDKAGFDTALGGDGTPWRSVVVVPTGHRAAADPQASLPKVRFPLSDLVLTR